MRTRIMLFVILVVSISVQAQQPLVPHNANEALETAQEALRQGNYHTANHYADMALKENRTAKQAAEVKIQAMAHLMETPQDSTRYIVALLDLHDHDRPNPIFNKLLMEYFTAPGKETELKQYIHDEIRKYPDSKWNWALNGEVCMKDGNWDKAIACFKHAVSLDSTFVEAIYNIGVCDVSKAVALHDSIEAKHEKLTPALADSIKNAYQQALASLEKVRSLDPNHKTVDWPKLLLHVYKVLDDPRRKELEESMR